MKIIQKPHSFRVLAVSDNSNSFGLYGHVLVNRSGLGFEAARSRGPWHKDLTKGDDIVLVETVRDGVPTKQFNWADAGFEIPRELPKCPPQVLKEVYP